LALRNFEKALQMTPLQITVSHLKNSFPTFCAIRAAEDAFWSSSKEVLGIPSIERKGKDEFPRREF
jgi:hypothetical protein